MHKRIFAVTLAMLMILGTIAPLVRVEASQMTAPTFNNITAPGNTGAPGTQVSSTATVLPAGPNDAFLFFDVAGADWDVGLPLTVFRTGLLVNNEGYVSVVADACYTPGEAIYRDVDAGGTVTVGDIRLTSRTMLNLAPAAVTYAAGTVVGLGDADAVAATVLVPFAVEGYYDMNGNLFYDVGEPVYYDRDTLMVAADLPRVSPADIRLLYPSATINLNAPTNGLFTNVGRIATATGSANTRVSATTATMGEMIYTDNGPTGATTADRDLGLPLIPVAAAALFPTWNVAGVTLTRFRDTNLNTAYNVGEPVYDELNGLVNFIVGLGDRRRTPVQIGGVTYLAQTVVAAGDLDIGQPLIDFSAVPARNEKYYDGNGNGIWDGFDANGRCIEPIYQDSNTPAGYLVSAGDTRLTDWDGRYVGTRTPQDGAFGQATALVGGMGVPGPTEGPNAASYTTAFTRGTTTTFNPTSVYLAGTVSYAAGTAVRAPDVRLRPYVVDVPNRLRYTAGTSVLAGQVDAPAQSAGNIVQLFQVVPALLSYVDLDGSARYDESPRFATSTPRIPGTTITATTTVTGVGATYLAAGPEPIYSQTGAAHAAVAALDVRRTYVSVRVAGVNHVYLPQTAVAVGDADVGGTLTTFAATYTVGGVLRAYYLDIYALAAYSYLEPIYYDVDGGQVGFLPLAATNTVGDLRLTSFNFYDLYGTPVSAMYDQADTVLAGAPDEGWELLTSWGTSRYVDLNTNGVYNYLAGEPIYSDVDGNGQVSVLDIRLTFVATGGAPGTLFYAPGSTVAAGNIDVGNALTAFAATNAFADHVFPDHQWNGGAADYRAHATYAAATATVTWTVPQWLPRGCPLNYVYWMVTEGEFAVTAAGAEPIADAIGPRPFASDFADAAPSIFTCTLLGYRAFANRLNIPVATSCSYSFLIPTPPLSVFLSPGQPDTFKSGVVPWQPNPLPVMQPHPGVALTGTAGMWPYGYVTPTWSHTIDTLRGIQGGAGQQNQVINQMNDYAIFVSNDDSIGDFEFTLNVWNWVNRIEIWMPPEFDFTRADRYSCVWTDITNDRNYISISKRSITDSVAPEWFRIRLGTHTAEDLPPWNDNPRMNIPPGTYHVRLMGIKAPKVAGLYFFKIRTNFGTIDPGSFPIVIAKSELNSAWMDGIVETGLAGLSGKVVAEGVTPEGRKVTAQAYFSPEDDVGWPLAPVGRYRYWIFGLAEGTYTITATASGYLANAMTGVTVKAGQSYHAYNIILQQGPWAQLTLWSKHGTGAIPFHNLWQEPFGTGNPYLAPNNLPLWPRRDALVELYDAKGALVGQWGSDSIASGRGYFGQSYNFATIPVSTTPIMALTAAIPTTTSFVATLVDGRGLTSLVWDGHVPKAWPDYVAGMDPGTYDTKAFMTGYVMDGVDAWQRKITVPTSFMRDIGASGGMYFEMDLRRSNWLEPTVHLEVVPRMPTGLGLAAIDAAGAEKGLAAWTVPGNFLPLTGQSVTLHIEGWSGVFNGWRSAVAAKDYGLEPGTYSTKMYMADMGDPTGLYYGFGGIIGRGWFTMREKPLATIALCNSPSAYSFRTRVTIIDLTIRSVDFQVPAMPQPWRFNGAEIQVDIVDQKGAVVTTINPQEWGLFQDSGAAAFTPYRIDANTVRIRFTGRDSDLTWSFYNLGYPLECEILSGDYPTSLDEGTYNFKISTVGYVPRRAYPVSILPGTIGDIQADMIIGGMFRVFFNFHSQLVDVRYLGPIRVEVFDSTGALVGAEVYGRTGYAAYNAATDFKFAPGAAGPFVGVVGERAWMARRFYPALVAPTWRWWPRNLARDNFYNIPAGSTSEMDVFGFYEYRGGACSRNDGGLWANAYDTTDNTAQLDMGIKGSADIPGVKGGGAYTVKIWAFDPFMMRSYYHKTVSNVQVAWGGSLLGGTDVYVSLDTLGRLSGYVSWTDMFGNMRMNPWAKVSTPQGFAYAAGLLTTPPTPTFIGSSQYNLWLPPGTYTVTITPSQGLKSFTAASYAAAVSDGALINVPVDLAPTGVPIPEFTATPIVLLTALAASLFILRRRRKETAK